MTSLPRRLPGTESCCVCGGCVQVVLERKWPSCGASTAPRSGSGCLALCCRCHSMLCCAIADAAAAAAAAATTVAVAENIFAATLSTELQPCPSIRHGLLFPTDSVSEAGLGIAHVSAVKRLRLRLGFRQTLRDEKSTRILSHTLSLDYRKPTSSQMPTLCRRSIFVCSGCHFRIRRTCTLLSSRSRIISHTENSGPFKADASASDVC